MAAIRFPRPADPLDDEWHRQRQRVIDWEIRHPPWGGPPSKEAMMELSQILKPATTTEARMKLFIFGASGVGKTYSALEIAHLIGGKIAVMDPEHGAALYADRFPHDLVRSDDISVLTEVIRAFAQGGHDYRTLIIDPVTLLWRSWQEQWERRFLVVNKGRAGHRGEWYEMGMKDWAPVKRTWEAFMRMLATLDMNVIVTAREKALYEGQGDNLRKAGETFDGEKGLDYWFDTVLHMQITGSGKRLAATVKDRTGRLEQSPVPWEFRTSAVVEAFGGVLARDVAATLVDSETLDEIRRLGVDLNLSESALSARARERFGAASIEELKPEDAAAVVAGLRKAVGAKTKETEE